MSSKTSKTPFQKKKSETQPHGVSRALTVSERWLGFVLGLLLVAGGENARAEESDPSYVDDGRYDYGLSQPNESYAVKVENDVMITMRDGAVLRGDVYRPDAEGRFPVIMAEAPYPRSGGMNSMLSAWPTR